MVPRPHAWTFASPRCNVPWRTSLDASLSSRNRQAVGKQPPSTPKNTIRPSTLKRRQGGKVPVVYYAHMGVSSPSSHHTASRREAGGETVRSSFVKVDFYAPPGGVRETVRLAKSAMSVGFDGFFVSETSHDPFVLLAAASQAATESLEFGTAIAVAFPRSPMVMAMASWDLARESKFMLGLGTQVSAHIRGRFSMEWGAPVERLRDYVAALRAIWNVWQSGGKLNYRGEFYRFTLMTPFFDPGPIADPVIPVWLAGVGPRSTRLAGEIADGFHVHPFHTLRYLDDVVMPGLADGRRMAARDPDAVAVGASVLVATGRTAEDVAEAAKKTKMQIAFYASTPAYRRVLELHGWDVGPALSAMSRRGQWDAMGDLVSDAMLDEVAVVAPVPELGCRLRERYGGRLDRIGVYPSASLTDAEWRLVIAGIRG